LQYTYIGSVIKCKTVAAAAVCSKTEFAESFPVSRKAAAYGIVE